MPRLNTNERNAIELPAAGLMIYNSESNNGEINAGTPTTPIWIGIKSKEKTIIKSVEKGNNVNTVSTAYELMPEMNLTTEAGSYLVLFNAQGPRHLTLSPENIISDTENLYTELMAYPGDLSHGSSFGNNEVLLPGVYDINAAVSIGGSLTIDGGGDANALFIIRSTGAFTTVAGTTLYLTGNARPENIFWVSEAAMSMGANTIFKGTLLAGGSNPGEISLGTGTNHEGRLLTKTGAVSLGANVLLFTPVGVSFVNMGMLYQFAIWTNSGAVSDDVSSTINGDIGTGVGALTIIGTHEGGNYSPSTITPSNLTEYSVYQNNEMVQHSSRTSYSQNTIVILNAMVMVNEGDIIEIRWKVDIGEAQINKRSLTLIKVKL